MRLNLKKHVNHHVEVKHEFEAPLQEVWDTFTDHTSWNTWAGQGVVSVENHGLSNKNGDGCLKITTMPAGDITAEEIISFEPCERLAYVVREGGYWTKDHTHEVLFDKTPSGGTIITWRCRFDPILIGSGWIIESMVGKNYRAVLLQLEKYLARDKKDVSTSHEWEVV
eukprot:CFRG0144T1